jgi:hypothetical protein
MSQIYEVPVKEIEKVLKSFFETRSAFTFFIGVAVLTMAFNFVLYWDHSLGVCQDKGDLHICAKSFVVFRNIAETLRDYFAIFIIAYFVAEGVRRHGYTAHAILPVAAFTIFINLFLWLFRDVFHIMQTKEFVHDDNASAYEVFQREFYHTVEGLNFVTESEDYSAIIRPILVVLVGVMFA